MASGGMQVKMQNTNVKMQKHNDAGNWTAVGFGFGVLQFAF